MVDTKKDSNKLNVKDIIMIVSITAAVLTGYNTLETKVAIMDEKVTENTKTLQDNNLELINYKLDNITVLMEDILKSMK